MMEPKNKIDEKMKIYLNDEITSSSYQYKKFQDKLTLRKKKIFNILFSKKKDIFKNDNLNNINDSRKIDINSLNCDNEIKKDVDNYIKTKFNIKNWFKFLFSSNINDNMLSLFLTEKYINLQVLEIKDQNKRKLSRNDTELIQKLCNNLLSDNIKIIYNSCSCLTNLTFFPKNIENRIYHEKNLEKILQFFDVLSKNITMLGYEPLKLFSNICHNEDVKIYLIKHSFLDKFYNFFHVLFDNKNINLNKEIEMKIIKNCVDIFSLLITICNIDDNYLNRFLNFIPIFKSITSKYYANIDDSMFDEEGALSLIIIWKFYSKNRENNKSYVNEIIKDSFFKVLVQVYYKIKDIKKKIKMIELFVDFVSIDDDVDKILINDGIIDFYAKEIEKYEFSNIEILNNIIFSCSNLSVGVIGQIEKLFESGIIFKAIDIGSFYINDNLDDEIKNILINIVGLICNCLNSDYDKIRKNILNYKKFIIINIFCKILKIDLDKFNKHQLIQKIVYSINDLNVISEELELNLEEEYHLLLINNSLDELLNNYYEKNYLEQNIKDIIDNIKTFIKDFHNK